jgi:hypothetical protein
LLDFRRRFVEQIFIGSLKSVLDEVSEWAYKPVSDIHSEYSTALKAVASL